MIPFSVLSLILSEHWQLTFVPPAWTSLPYSPQVSVPMPHVHLDVASQTHPLKLTSCSPWKLFLPSQRMATPSSQVLRLNIFESSLMPPLFLSHSPFKPLNPLGTALKIYPKSSNFSPPPITTLAKTPCLSPTVSRLSPKWLSYLYAWPLSAFQLWPCPSAWSWKSAVVLTSWWVITTCSGRTGRLSKGVKTIHRSPPVGLPLLAHPYTDHWQERLAHQTNRDQSELSPRPLSSTEALFVG